MKERDRDRDRQTEEIKNKNKKIGIGVAVLHLVHDGIYALEKANIRSNPAVRSFSIFTYGMVPMLA